jgi:hypothetical protein
MMEEQHEEQQMQARLRQWRQAHPHATFDEIEDAVQEEVACWQAQMVAELAAEDAEEGVPQDTDVRPVCRACGVPMQRCGTRTREVLSRLGQPIRLERAYYACPACGAGRFPPR